MALIYINDELKQKILKLKTHPKDSYGDIIEKYLPQPTTSETQIPPTSTLQ